LKTTKKPLVKTSGSPAKKLLANCHEQWIKNNNHDVGSNNRIEQSYCNSNQKVLTISSYYQQNNAVATPVSNHTNPSTLGSNEKPDKGHKDNMHNTQTFEV